MLYHGIQRIGRNHQKATCSLNLESNSLIIIPLGLNIFKRNLDKRLNTNNFSKVKARQNILKCLNG